MTDNPPAPEVPVTVDALTEVFRSAGILRTHQLGGIEVEPIGTGQMADTVRCAFTEPIPAGMPASCVVKLPVSEGQTGVTARHAAVYRRELRFYEQLHPEVPRLRSPRFYGSYEVDGEPALVLEDVRGGRQGDQIQGASMRQAQLAVDQLATYQPRWWNDGEFGAQDWLQRRAGVAIAERQSRYRAAWEKVRGLVAGGLVPGAVEVIEEYGERCDAWSQAYDGAMCLAHYDYRLDNMLFDTDGIWVVDWQTLGWGPPAWDLAYFLGSSLAAADRRACERELVTRHARLLREAGVDGFSDAVAWDAYRQMAFGTFLLTMPAAGEVRSDQRARQMYVTMWNRAATMVLDLGSREFLEG